MDKYSFEIIRDSTNNPYFEEVYDYKCDGEKGELEFNGYYYVNDISNKNNNDIQFACSLPKEEMLCVTEFQDVPPRIWNEERRCSFINIDGESPLLMGECTERIVNEHLYKILVEKREKIINTSEYGPVEDNDGETINVCFFPTYRQKIYFRVLEIIYSKINEKHVSWCQTSSALELSC